MQRLVLLACVALLAGFLGSPPPAAAQTFDLPSFRVELEPAQYKMVSVPIPLQDRRFEAVLGDDFGRYADGLWRLFRYDPTARRYDEFPNVAADFSPGVAVWVIHRFGQDFDIDEDLPLDTFVPAPVRLTVFNGWNQIGTPFPATIPNCAALLREAARQIPAIRRIETPLRFDGRQLVPTNTCEPWEGYFVFVEADGRVEVVLDPDLLGTVAARPEAPAGAAVVVEAGGYVMHLTARMPEAGLEDAHNAAGLLPPGAAATATALDFHEPPMVGEHLQLALVEGGERFGGKFQVAEGEGARWDVEIRATRADHPVEFAVEARGTLPAGFQRYLLDRDERAALPLDDAPLRLDLRAPGAARRLTLLVGTEAYAQAQAGGIELVPATSALLASYPNPFQAETTIRYRVAAAGPVTLDVYDVLGRRVRRLVGEARPAGLHAVAWDGRDDAGRRLGSGLYLYRLRAGSFAQTRTTTLVR